jgi:hypothetical protein
MSVSSIPSSTDYSSAYASSSPSATVGNLLASDASLSPTSTTTAATVSPYQQEYASLLAQDNQELLTSFNSSSDVTTNTLDVLSQFASLQAVGYQTAASTQANATAANAAAAAQNAADTAALAAPFNVTDPYATPGSGDPLDLLGQNVDATA